MSAFDDAVVDIDGFATDADAHRVAYEFSCPGNADEFAVTGFDGVEELSRPYRLSIHLEALHEVTDTGDLLGRDVVLRIERGDQQRVFYGIVARLTVHDSPRIGQTSTVEVVPALCALQLSQDTRIFQGKSAIEIVESVLSEGLAKYDRAVDSTSLDRERYVARDYCVQYRETPFDFVHRLLEEEGVGYHFRHDEDGHETMVLFDDNADLTRVSTMDHGPVRFDPAERAWAGAEPILRFGTSVELAPSTVTVRDHDWTRARPTIEESRSVERLAANAGAQPGHEVYEHGFDRQLTIHEDNALVATLLDIITRGAMPFGPPPGLAHMVHNLPGAVLDGFTTSDVSHQVSVRHQRHQRDARVSRGIGAVTGFSPGSTFGLVGHPTLGADGDYLLTKVVHSSIPTVRPPEDGSQPRASHNYENAFECLPVATAWRPDRRTPKPRIYGVQTGCVTGPLGMDVHTDQHGRIKVRFNWDRSDPDLSGNYTCWLRVSQTWAGQGSPGFMFIPRVGMEVVVSFVDGDPDRPLVTGCVYNGANPTPGLLPAQATKSIIRTRTVPHGPGHNELSFEDAMGMERVHVRAQRDLDELVLNDHTTSVTRHQINRVGGDQRETVLRHQRLMVNGHQAVQIRGNQTVSAMSNRRVRVGGSESTHVAGDYSVAVDGGSALLDVQRGSYVASAAGSMALIQDEKRFIELSSDSGDPGIALNSEGATVHISKDVIELKVGSSVIRIAEGSIQVNSKTFPSP